MQGQSEEHTVAVIGPRAGGKSSLLKFLAGLPFTKEHEATTSVMAQSVELDDPDAVDQVIKLQLWEAGSSVPQLEEAPEVSYVVQQSLAVIVCFDVGQRQQFDLVQRHFAPMVNSGGKDRFLLLLGCKTDAAEEETRVGQEEAQSLAQQHGGVFLETSAVDGTNVSLAFTVLRMRVHRLLRRREERARKEQQDTAHPSSGGADAFEQAIAAGVGAGAGAEQAQRAPASDPSDDEDDDDALETGADPGIETSPGRLHTPGQGPTPPPGNTRPESSQDDDLDDLAGLSSIGAILRRSQGKGLAAGLGAARNPDKTTGSPGSNPSSRHSAAAGGRHALGSPGAGRSPVADALPAPAGNGYAGPGRSGGMPGAAPQLAPPPPQAAVSDDYSRYKEMLEKYSGDAGAGGPLGAGVEEEEAALRSGYHLPVSEAMLSDGGGSASLPSAPTVGSAGEAAEGAERSVPGPPVSISTITLKDLFNAAEQQKRLEQQRPAEPPSKRPARSRKPSRASSVEPVLGVTAHLAPEEAARAAAHSMQTKKRRAAREAVPVGLPVPSASASAAPGPVRRVGPPPLPSEYPPAVGGPGGFGRQVPAPVVSMNLQRSSGATALGAGAGGSMSVTAAAGGRPPRPGDHSWSAVGPRPEAVPNIAFSVADEESVAGDGASAVQLQHRWEDGRGSVGAPAVSVALSGTTGAARAMTAHRLKEVERAEAVAVKREKRRRIKRRRQVLMYIDVGIGGGQVGRIEVRRDSKAFSLAHQFVRQHRLDVGFTVKLSKLISDRTNAFLKEEERRDQAEKRRANRREVEEYRRRFTRPKPFQLRSDAIAASRGATGAARGLDAGGPTVPVAPVRPAQSALVGRLHVQVGQGKTGTIVIREGDDPYELVENFRKAFGLRRGVARHLVDTVQQRLHEHEEILKSREAARQGRTQADAASAHRPFDGSVAGGDGASDAGSGQVRGADGTTLPPHWREGGPGPGSSGHSDSGHSAGGRGLASADDWLARRGGQGTHGQGTHAHPADRFGRLESPVPDARWDGGSQPDGAGNRRRGDYLAAGRGPRSIDGSTARGGAQGAGYHATVDLDPSRRPVVHDYPDHLRQSVLGVDTESAKDKAVRRRKADEARRTFAALASPTSTQSAMQRNLSGAQRRGPGEVVPYGADMSSPRARAGLQRLADRRRSVGYAKDEDLYDREAMLRAAAGMRATDPAREQVADDEYEHQHEQQGYPPQARARGDHGARIGESDTGYRADGDYESDEDALETEPPPASEGEADAPDRGGIRERTGAEAAPDSRDAPVASETPAEEATPFPASGSAQVAPRGGGKGGAAGGAEGRPGGYRGTEGPPSDGESDDDDDDDSEEEEDEEPELDERGIPKHLTWQQFELVQKTLTPAPARRKPAAPEPQGTRHQAHPAPADRGTHQQWAANPLQGIEPPPTQPHPQHSANPLQGIEPPPTQPHPQHSAKAAGAKAHADEPRHPQAYSGTTDPPAPPAEPEHAPPARTRAPPPAAPPAVSPAAAASTAAAPGRKAAGPPPGLPPRPAATSAKPVGAPPQPPPAARGKGGDVVPAATGAPLGDGGQDGHAAPPSGIMGVSEPAAVEHQRGPEGLQDGTGEAGGAGPVEGRPATPPPRAAPGVGVRVVEVDSPDGDDRHSPHDLSGAAAADEASHESAVVAAVESAAAPEPPPAEESAGRDGQSLPSDGDQQKGAVQSKLVGRGGSLAAAGAGPQEDEPAAAAPAPAAKGGKAPSDKASSKGRKVQFVLEVQLENGAVTPITVRQGDSITKLARAYMSEHGIPEEELPQVKAVIKDGVAKHNEFLRERKRQARNGPKAT